MKKIADPPLPLSLVIPLGILAVSTASVLIRYAQVYTTSLTIAAFRLGLAVVFLFPYIAIKHRQDLKSLSCRDGLFALLAGGLLAIHFAAWITSLEFTSVASSVVFVSTTPLWVAAVAPFLLGEKNNLWVILGMVVSILGGTIVAASDACALVGPRLVCPSRSEFVLDGAFLGDLLALLGAISGAGYLIIGRHLRRKFPLAPYVFFVYGAAAIYLLLGMLITDGLPGDLPSQVYFWLVLLALVPQLIGHSIFNWALRYLPAGYVSVTLLGEPIGSTILAYIFLKEKPIHLKIIGAILILVGIAVASTAQNLPQNTSPVGGMHD